MKNRRPTAAPAALSRALSSLLPPALRRNGRMPGGKLSRARLLLLLGRGPDADGRSLLQTAAAVEAVHLAALIHDDVLDGSARRRGEATLHRTVNSGPALLLGDIIFARAIASINRLGRTELTERFLMAVEDTCAGEILETNRRNRLPWTGELYHRIIGLKTAALFRFCGEAAAILSGKRDRAEWGRLGGRIGRAYQIVDDCLDLAPASVRLGKDRLSDLKNGVPSLPVILGLADPRTASAVRAALGQKSARLREDAGRALRRNGHLRRAAADAERYLVAARAARAAAPLAAYLGELETRINQIRGWQA